MEPEKLIHLIYASAACGEVGPDDVAEILATAREINAANGVTGMLLYSGTSFLQVLEGSAPNVDNIYASICADSRHTNVTLIVREPIFRRTFGSWRMGYLAADSATLSVLEGADGIINAQDELVKLDSGRAKKLLAAFASGRWQLKISDN